jgi:hypothetical protein
MHQVSRYTPYYFYKMLVTDKDVQCRGFGSARRENFLSDPDFNLSNPGHVSSARNIEKLVIKITGSFYGGCFERP